MTSDPAGELDARFSGPDATPTPWSVVDDILSESQIFWLSTVGTGATPHVTPLITVWDGSALFFCTGSTEQKAKNLERSPQCALTTGGSSLNSGIDIVVSGTATPVTDDPTLLAIAAEYKDKYGEDWVFTVQDGALVNEGGRVLLFRVSTPTVFAFAKGDFGRTRFRL